jgi:hypothetical protein
MASWEDFSRIITEAKESKKLDPVDDDVNSDGKVDMNGSKVGCNDPDPRSIKTQVNLVKNKLRAMGLKMSQELEGEQLDELSLPGTGTVLAPKTDVTGTRMYRQNKFLGMNVGSPYQNSSNPSVPKASEVQRYNSQPNRPSTIQKTSDIGTSITGYTSQVAKPKSTPAPTAPKPAAQRPQTASAAMSQVFKGTPLSGVANIANRYDRQINYRDQSPETRRMLGLQNSYEQEGELVDEGKKDLPQTKMYRKAGNLARQALSSKGAKKEKAMDRSAKIVSAITRETERKRFDEIGKSPAHNEEYQLDEEGMSLKDFKANRRKITGAEERSDARKRGHEGKTWADSGRTYSPDEAKSRRTKMSDVDRSARHSTAVDPDNEDTDSYSADKTKNPKKLRKQKAMGELGEGYIEEKSLSRAQQRFFGMVRAAQDGKMKSPSPEVAKAAKEMTKKQAHDFAATKHKGLPEKKEVKEEISLVEKMIAQYSPISEGKLDDLLSDIRGSGEDPNQSQKKRVLKKKSAQDNPEASGGTEKRGKGSKTSRERQTVISGTTRVKAKSVEAKGKIEVEREKSKAKLEAEKERTNREKLKGERQERKIEVDRERRAEKDTEKEKKDAEKSAERQKSLEQKDKQKRIDAGNKAVGDYEKEQTKKKQRRDELKSAFVRPSGGATATEKDSDLTVLSAAGSNIGSGIKALGKTAFNLGKIAVNRRAEKKDEIKKQEIRKKAESSPIQSETFSNWREEFIVEIDDVSTDNDAPQKIIDVSKKKNKIEINPKLDEGVEIEESKK